MLHLGLELREAEVAHLHLPPVVHQHIARLDVPVNDLCTQNKSQDFLPNIARYPRKYHRPAYFCCAGIPVLEPRRGPCLF